MPGSTSSGSREGCYETDGEEKWTYSMFDTPPLAEEWAVHHVIIHLKGEEVISNNGPADRVIIEVTGAAEHPNPNSYDYQFIDVGDDEVILFVFDYEGLPDYARADFQKDPASLGKVLNMLDRTSNLKDFPPTLPNPVELWQKHQATAKSQVIVTGHQGVRRYFTGDMHELAKNSLHPYL